MLILATARPEFRSPWSLRSHHSVISLSPLDRDVAQMVGELAARHALSQEVVEGVNERTGGVPLFVEEVTRLLLERGEAGGLQAIPLTLQQSLAARLDRLGDAREVAQIGAVLGRDFTYALLRTVGGLGDSELQSRLDRLAGADLLIAEGAGPQATYRFKHALIQDAAYDSLLKSRRQALHRRAAELLRDDPDRATAAPEVIAHHFTEAGLNDLAIEWWGRAGDQALRRSAFQEAIAHLGKAIAMADKGGQFGSPIERLKLQTGYGQALMFAKGFGAEEAKVAFTRAQQLEAGVENAGQRFDTYYGLWVRSLWRGELRLARETAETFRREAEEAEKDAPRPEAAPARRCLGLTCLVQGEFTEAQSHLEEALRIYNPDWDPEQRFAADTGATARIYLAHAFWQLGKPGQAHELMEEAVARAVDPPRPQTPTNAHHFKAVFEIYRGDAEAARRDAEIVVELSRQHGLALFLAWGTVALCWANARLHDRETGMTEFRAALAAYTDQGNRFFAPFFQGLLAELEAEEPGAAGAVTRIQRALALAEQTGELWTDAFLHRIRGDILSKAHPEHPARAEEAYLAAIAIAREQGARSFGLRAALSLAKLYWSTARPVEAHDVLAPALEGFSPTPEMPEIAEAQALLTALAETDEVKAAIAQRERRLHLQLSYSRAMMWSKGFGADEALSAYARARELAAEGGADEDRYSLYYGQWLGLLNRGGLQQSRATAEAFLVDAAAAGKRMEAAVAHRILALNCFLLGDFAEARSHADRAIEFDDPARTAESRLRFGVDCGICALLYLAMAKWQMGEVDEAIRLSQEALTQATRSSHVQTVANTAGCKAALDAARGDAEAADRTASMGLALSREHGMEFFIAWSEMPLLWARSRLRDPAAGSSKLRETVANFMAGGHQIFAPLYAGLLAELDAGGPDPNEALTQIDAAIALAQQTGERWTDSMLHRIRGEILLKRDPANTTPAEEAFQTAIAVAQQRKARSFQLQAALSLAKLHQSTARPAEAHAVLAHVLEGFSPTPEMPEIAEAQTLLATLA
jgi:predicted ATPase